MSVVSIIFIWITKSQLQPSWNDILAAQNDEEGMIRAREFFLGLVDKKCAGGIPVSNVFMGKFASSEIMKINCSQMIFISTGRFSQGGCVSLFTGLTGRHSLGAVFALSAYLPMIERVEEMVSEQGIDRKISKELPTFMGNGNGDPQVKWNWGFRSQEAVTKMGFKVDFRTYR